MTDKDAIISDVHSFGTVTALPCLPAGFCRVYVDTGELGFSRGHGRFRSGTAPDTRLATELVYVARTHDVAESSFYCYCGRSKRYGAFR